MKRLSLLFLLPLFFPFMAPAQEADTTVVEDKPQRPAFESSFIIDNPTDLLPVRNTLEAVISHRFGTFKGENDLLGIWAPGNIRLGINYSVLDWVTLGFGTTKNDRLQDFNWKVGLLRQTRSDRIPVNVSYYGNFTIDARSEEDLIKQYTYYIDDYKTSAFLDQHRYSFFHQLIVSRRFNSNLSLQVAGSVSHYNIVPERMRNDVIAISAGGRYKISPQTSILVDYTHPFIHHLDGEELDMDPKDGLSIGVEFRTSSHAFQIYMSSYDGIVPQKNIMFNQNDFFDGDILLGFTITRLYNF